MPDSRYQSSLTGNQVDLALQDMAQHTSEAYAVGKRAGTDVQSTDPTYHNNSKYYALTAAASAEKIEDLTVSAESLPYTSTATVIKTETTAGVYNLHFGIPQGEPGGGGGTSNYNNLTNKPQINGVTLSGDKTSGDLSLVASNAAITAGTKTKITYDAKGLVTAGADLSASDIPSLAASKITSGTFDAGRIPNLDASKVTSGTFADVRIASAATWNAKQNALTAGANITIVNDVISASAGGSTAKKGTLSLTSSWTSQTGYSEQTVTITGYTVTNNTKIDIQPDYSVISQMATDGTTALYVQNNNGTLKAIAVGTAPTTSLSVQVTIVETEAL